MVLDFSNKGTHKLIIWSGKEVLLVYCCVVCMVLCWVEVIGGGGVPWVVIGGVYGGWRLVVVGVGWCGWVGWWLVNVSGWWCWWQGCVGWLVGCVGGLVAG